MSPPRAAVPFSAEAADYTRRLSLKTDRHVDPGAALADLLGRYSKGAVSSRREQNLARRLSARSTSTDPAAPATASASDLASNPGVIDLLAHLERRSTGPQVSDDLDVFERYYAEHPEGGLEVFDE